MSPLSMMVKALLLQNMTDFARVLIPAESTMRSEPCSMKHFPAIFKSILWGMKNIIDFKLL